MKTTTPDAELLVNMPFPVRGTDLSREFDLQADGTTALGENVRTFEHDKRRGRGGSRPGHVRYINERVEEKDLAAPNPALSMVIQHLNVIVDPTTEALLAPEENDEGDVDPSTNTNRNPSPPRRIRRGGSGRQPTRKKKKQKYPLTVTANDRSKPAGTAITFTGHEFTSSGLQAGDTITQVRLRSNGAPASVPSSAFPFPIIPSRAGIRSPTGRRYTTTYVNGELSIGEILFVQAKLATYAGVGTGGVTFDAPVVTGNLLVVAIAHFGHFSEAALTGVITDNLGNTYQRAVLSNAGSVDTVSVWWAISAFDGSCTATLDDFNGSGAVSLGALEYSGLSQIDPLDWNATNQDISGTAWSTDSIDVTGPGELMIGVFAHGTGFNITFTPTAGETLRLNQNDSSVFEGIYITDKITASAAQALTGTASLSTIWAAAGLSFKQ